MSLCRDVSYVIGRGVCYDQCVFLAKVFLVFLYLCTLCSLGVKNLLYYDFKAKFVAPDYLLIFYFCIPVPYDEKNMFLLVLVPKDLVGLCRTI